MANTTQAQISNIFNLMVQLEPRLNFYHFGWRSDILRNIDNNFDQGVKTGRLFPAVHFAVPEYTQFVDALQYESLKEEVEVTLYFDNLQDYNNTGATNTLNLLEQWDYLKSIAEDFVINLNFVLEHYNAGFISLPKFEQFSHGHNDRLISWKVSFKLTHYIECTEAQNQIDTSLLPATIEETDLENYKSQGPPPDRCTTILGMLTDEDICSCIMPTLDFSEQEGNVFDCLTEEQKTDLATRFGGEVLRPKLALSTRKIVANYTGDCMKIRRGSDDMTQEIGFVLSGSDYVLDTASIISFCGGSIGYVQTWYDQSPNAAHATQTITVWQPQIYDGFEIITTNGFPCLFFPNRYTLDIRALELRYPVSVDLFGDVMLYVAKLNQVMTGNNAMMVIAGQDYDNRNVGFYYASKITTSDQAVYCQSANPFIGMSEEGKTTQLDFKLNSFNYNTIRRNGVDVGTYTRQEDQTHDFLIDRIASAPDNAILVGADVNIAEIILQHNSCSADPAASQAAIESEIVNYYNL